MLVEHMEGLAEPELLEEPLVQQECMEEPVPKEGSPVCLADFELEFQG
jgi:hypothetical protein